MLLFNFIPDFVIIPIFIGRHPGLLVFVEGFFNPGIVCPVCLGIRGDDKAVMKGGCPMAR